MVCIFSGVTLYPKTIVSIHSALSMGVRELNSPNAEIKLMSCYTQILLALEKNMGLESWLSS